MFGRKKKPVKKYDPETQEPILKKSICTGEMTVGFVDKETATRLYNSCLDLSKAIAKFITALKGSGMKGRKNVPKV